MLLRAPPPARDRPQALARRPGRRSRSCFAGLRWRSPRSSRYSSPTTAAESLFVGADKALASARFVLSAKLPRTPLHAAGRVLPAVVARRPFGWEPVHHLARRHGRGAETADLGVGRRALHLDPLSRRGSQAAHLDVPRRAREPRDAAESSSTPRRRDARPGCASSPGSSPQPARPDLRPGGSPDAPELLPVARRPSAARRPTRAPART